MTQQLITELRKLHTQSTDEDDRELLGAILAAHEAAQVAVNLTDETAKCKVCKQLCSALLVNGDGFCPSCQLIYMHDTFSRRRADAIKNGW